VTLHLADAAISALATLLPQSCDSDACHRQSATFGNLVCHAQLNDQTHALLAELIPEVSVGFLRDVTPLSRQLSALSEEDERHLDRLRLPITFLSGEHNETLAPLGTEESYQQLCSAHGPALYRRHVLAGYGHLDCLIGKDADRDVFPLIAQSLGPLLRAHRTGSSVLT
jgi:cholesterol oxidase